MTLLGGLIERTWPEVFDATRAESHGLPRSGYYALADVRHDDGTESCGVVLAGPYETVADALTAGRMLERGEEPDGGYPVDDPSDPAA